MALFDVFVVVQYGYILGTLEYTDVDVENP